MALYDCPEINEEPQHVIAISQETYGIMNAPMLLEQMRHLAGTGKGLHLHYFWLVPGICLGKLPQSAADL